MPHLKGKPGKEPVHYTARVLGACGRRRRPSYQETPDEKERISLPNYSIFVLSLQDNS